MAMADLLIWTKAQMDTGTGIRSRDAGIGSSISNLEGILLFEYIYLGEVIGLKLDQVRF